MKLLDILNSPWAISHQRLIEIQSIYRAHFRGEKIDWKAIEAKAGLLNAASKDTKPYEIIDGVAVIEISGVLTKGFSFLTWLFGGTSMQHISQAFQEAVSDPQVKSIILFMDSPGGTVDGTQELANLIYNGKNGKQVIAYSNGMIASAAYWIASAADAIYISGDTVQIGSIGVVATHVDISKKDEMMGEKYTEITAGTYKSIASSHAPLTQEGRQSLQDQADHIYTIFVGDVARNRNISEEDALKMADGKIFMGQKAVEVGLVDGVSTFDQLINTMSAGVPGIKTIKAQEEEPVMNIAKLKAEHPEIYQAVIDIGKAEAIAGVETRIAAARAEGIAAEQKRIIDIQALSIPGHENIISAALKDSNISAADVALQIVGAEKQIKIGAQKAVETDTAGLNKLPVTGVETVEQIQGKKGEKEFMALVDEYVAEHKCSKTVAMQEIMKSNPAAHKAYIAKMNAR